MTKLEEFSQRKRKNANCLFVLLLTLLVFRVAATAAQDQNFIHLGRGKINHLQWNPTGGVFAVGSSTGVWIFDSDLNIVSHIELSEGAAIYLDWNARGDEMAVVDETQGMRIVKFSSDFERHDLMLAIENVGNYVGWSPDSTKIALWGAEKMLVYGIQDQERNSIQSLNQHERLHGHLMADILSRAVMMRPMLGTVLLANLFFP